MITIIILVESSITIGVVLWVLFSLYKQGQTQKLAALTLLELSRNNKEDKIKNLTTFLQDKLHLPEDSLKQMVQLLLAKESLLFQELIKLATLNDKQLLAIYNKLQDLLAAYYPAKPPAAINAEENLKTKAEQEEFLSACQTKFIRYLEAKNLITVDIKAQIHTFDKTKK
jgi:uncharacterized membrane protein YvbJ